MSSESFQPETRTVEERTIISSVDEPIPTKDTVSATKSTSEAIPTSSPPSHSTHTTQEETTFPGTTQKAAASFVPSTQGIKETVSSYIPETVKDYLPTAVVGSTAPQTTLPSAETGQNTTPQTHSATGPLPGPPGEKDVAVLPDEKLYNSHPISTGTSTSHTSHPTTTFKASLPSQDKYTVPSQEEGHTPSTHTAAGPLPSGESVAVPPSMKTHEAATTGGVADLPGEELAKLPGERAAGALPTLDDSGRTKSQVEGNRTAEGGVSGGVGAIPGYLGEERVARVENLKTNEVPSTNTSFGADSQASTRVLPGSIAPKSTSTSTSAFSHQPSSNEKGAMDKTKDTFASMERGAKHTEEKVESKVPGTQAHKEVKEGMRDDRGVSANQELNTQARTHPLAGPGGQWKGQSVDEKGLEKQNIETPLSTRATTGHEPPSSKSKSAAGDRLASAAAGASAVPTTSTTGAPVTDQHPDMPTQPTKADPTRHAGATEARYVPDDKVGDKTGHERTGKEKPGLMDKIKGEAKVISGKIGRDEEKVEIGKRMMGKN